MKVPCDHVHIVLRYKQNMGKQREQEVKVCNGCSLASLQEERKHTTVLVLK